MKLISSVSPSQRDHHQLFPKKETVDEVVKGLCIVCNLNTPPQGLPQFPPEEEDDNQNVIRVKDSLRVGGMELLGVYHRCRDEAMDITLFISRCLKTGDDLCLDPCHIIEVVLIHELAHYLTHLGCYWREHVYPPGLSEQERKTYLGYKKPDEKGVEFYWCWEDFCEEEAKVTEDFAQAATYFYLRASIDQAKLHCFETLSLYSPEQYKTWDKWKKRQTQGQSFWQCLGQLQEEIWKERFCGPPDTEEEAGGMVDLGE